MTTAVPDTMRCGIRTAPGRVEIGRRPVPRPRPNDILIKVAQVGVCGGDLHYFKGDALARTDKAIIIGHEAAGTVVDDAHGFRSGQHVVIDPMGWCGKCEYCERGHHSLCSLRSDMGYHIDGACAEYIAVPYDHCFVVPDSVSWEEAVSIHALAAIVHCSDKVRHLVDETAVILGLGPAGLVHLMVEKKCHGAGKVIAAARTPFRLQLARELGADVVVDTTKEDLLTRVLAETDGAGADFVVETTGSPQIQTLTTALTKKLGHIAIYVSGLAEISLKDVVRKELTIFGATGPIYTMRTAVDLVASHRIEVGKLITHHFELADTQRAFELAVADKKGDFAKATITIG